MSSRKVNPNRVKLQRTYTASELAACLLVHKNTISNWQRKGLTPIDGARPILFLGSTVRDFLRKQNAARRRPCPPGNLYCFRCRLPRPPADGLVEYRWITATSGNLRAVCATCETVICRRATREALAVTMPGLDVQFPEAKVRLIGSPSPSLDCDSKRKAAA